MIDELITFALGIAIGVLIGMVGMAVKMDSHYTEKALASGCAEWKPDTTHKVLEWRKP